MSQNADLKGQKHGYWWSTIGRKQVVALTGLLLSLFVLSHMAGNLLILVSAQKYNEYGHAIVSNPLVGGVEVLLLLAVLFHVFLALYLQILNLKARPQKYARCAQGEKATSFVNRSMAAQGLVILAFIILHLATFKYGEHYWVDYGHGSIRDLHRLVVEVFHKPGYVVWYLVALVVLGFHLSHGVASMLQTWGIHHPRYQIWLHRFSQLYAVVVAAGFISQPIYVYFFYQG